METEGMSLEELKQLKRTQYEEARKSGVFQRLATVGRELGREVGRPGPKYLWEESGVRVFVDDYRGYVTAHANEQLVASNHPCTRLFVAGQWQDLVLAYYPEAQEKASLREAARRETEKQRLQSEQTL
ncbi:MAG: hypothetical protein L0387_42605 [Acidobacteria bacterium]|nr:hypothetical protein [Acidobacteriota bacterium]MCI0721999.1 hypothetical protein [Acidobacteriota bacterium]